MTASRLCKSREFKLGMPAFESRRLEGLAEEPSDVFVGMEATGHYWMGLCSRGLPPRAGSVSDQPWRSRPSASHKGRRSKNDRVDALLIAETLRIGEYVETKLASDEVQSLRTLTRYRQAIKEEAAQVKIRLTCVMDSYFPEYAAFSPTCSARRRLPSWRSRPCPPSCRRKARRRWPATSRRPPGGVSGRPRRPSSRPPRNPASA